MLPQARLPVYRPSGHPASLKYVSTVMHHSARSHSGIYRRFLFCSHQACSSADEVYIPAVSCSCLTRTSNSVATAGAGGMGCPQLGFPRLRVIAGRQPVSPSGLIIRAFDAAYSSLSTFNGQSRTVVPSKMRVGEAASELEAQLARPWFTGAAFRARCVRGATPRQGRGDQARQARSPFRGLRPLDPTGDGCSHHY